MAEVKTLERGDYREGLRVRLRREEVLRERYPDPEEFEKQRYNFVWLAEGDPTGQAWWPDGIVGKLRIKTYDPPRPGPSFWVVDWEGVTTYKCYEFGLGNGKDSHEFIEVLPDEEQDVAPD